MKNKMNAVIIDFNGTLFFDTDFHTKAWSEIYRELHPGEEQEPDGNFYCGPRNDEIIKNIAPWLTPEERTEYSLHKEELYRRICKRNPKQVHLVPGAEELLDYLKEQNIPFTLASASIKENVDFYFEQFSLGKWFDRDLCVYDDGSYTNKGEMHVEAAKRLGTTLSKCIVVEDSISAVSHAKSNGAGCIVGIGAEDARQNLIQAGIHHFIHDFTEFDKEWLMSELY